MTVALDDVIRVTWKAVSTAPATIINNVFWYKVTTFAGGPDSAIFTEIFDEILALFQNIQLEFTPNYSAESIRAVNQTKKEFLGDDGVTFVGTAAVADANAAQVAVEILARGIQLGHTGRKYIGPVSDNTVDDGQVSPASLTRFGLFADQYDTAFAGIVTANLYTPGTAQLGAGGVVIGFREFVQGRNFVQETCRTQRRRTPGRGL